MTGPTSRMLALLSLLQARREWPGAVLSERLGVTTRTIRRDIDRLRELGYRIEAAKGPDGGYRLESGSELPPLLFDDDQAIAIAVALQSAPASGVALDGAAERALATIRQVMPSRLRHRIDGVAFEAQPADSPVAPAVIEAVSAAVRARAVLRFDYPGASHPRRTEPHGLVSRGGRWYLVAWDLDAEDWRLFRVDRMQPRTPTGPRFAPRAIPAGDASAFVSARAKGASSHDAWPCTGSFEVRLPAREVAPWVRDGEIEERADGWTRVTVGSWSWHGLLAEIVRFGADVRRLEPAELAQTARDHAARLAAADVTPERDPG